MLFLLKRYIISDKNQQLKNVARPTGLIGKTFLLESFLANGDLLVADAIFIGHYGAISLRLTPDKVPFPHTHVGAIGGKKHGGIRQNKIIFPLSKKGKTTRKWTKLKIIKVPFPHACVVALGEKACMEKLDKIKESFLEDNNN